MDNEQPRQELVKCVVVGDTAVGKTRLICARACNKQFSLSQLLNTHVPTVWAIDQYRIYKEVLERSWVSVDGVNVSLRLWDTFGDHDKDRRFAYGRSDVVVLCFSVANAASLRNCLVMWYPEIRKFCPNTPVLLVGCKNDLRHIYKDDEYLQFCRERSPLVRATKESDLVMPGEGRAVAREIGIDYYETSVLSFYGITELFDNVVRSALISRRQQRFWMTSLKRVQRPIPQVPFCPPKPKFVNVVVKPSTICEDFHTLYRSGSFSDLVLVAGDTMIYAHQFIVAAASSAFNKLLNMDVEGDLAEENTPEIKGAFCEATSGVFDSDTDHLLAMDPHEETARYLDENPEKSKNGCFYSSENHYKTLNHAAFESVSIKKPEKELINEKDPYTSNTIEGDEPPNCPLSVQKVVTLSKLVSSATLLQVVHFMYTGSIFCRMCSVPLPNFSSLRQVARLLELSELEIFLSNLLDTGKFSNDNFGQEYIQVFLCRLSELCLDDNFACDIILRLDDGEIEAHKALLTARCDVMRAMFSGDFRESNARIVSFPGLKVRTFKVILHYLYTDTVPSLSIKECLPAIELANRLCIPRLINLVEREIVDSLNRVLQSGEDVSENCLFLLEPLQMHNADQLVDWCLTYLSTNYNNVCHMFSKQLRSLHPENQAWLNRHRWPPVWYLKDFDFYERCIIERQRENYPLKQLKRTRNPSAGCLCFSSKTRRKSPKQFIHTI